MRARDGWRRLGACREHDPEMFFPTGTGLERELQTRAAIAVCAGCPVRPECAAAAGALGIVDGIWAGLTPEERERVRRPARAS